MTTQSLSYFQPGESYYWYDGKQLNSTSQPEVVIVKDSDSFISSSRSDRKKIVIKCPLPISDLSLSLNRGDRKSFKPVHTHPLVRERTTVSAFHVKLAFLDLQGLNINMAKSPKPADFDKDNFLDFSSRTFINNNLFKNNKAPERFIVHYDSKCRSCQLNAAILSDFDPFRAQSILCSLKVQFFENNLGSHFFFIGKSIKRVSH